MPQDTNKGKDRKRVVVEEVETPVSEEMVSSKEIETGEPKPQISEKAVETAVEEAKEEIGQEIHEEEKHLHDIHTEDSQPPLPEKKPISPVWWIMIPGIFLLGALLGGIIFYQKGISKGETEPSPTPLATQSSQATPTPSDQADLTKFTINVLNGSGIAGEAGKVKDLLTQAGFKVSGTGNASAYNFTKTIIKAKSSVSESYLIKLADTLGKSYVLDKNQTLSDSSTDDVQVVVGSSKAQ